MPDESPKKANILLLVSDPIVRAVMNETLDGKGYTVWATGDLGRAVDFLGMSTPDLFITRSYVEGLSGHDAAKYLRTKCGSMKVLIVGGLLDDDRLYNRDELEGLEVFPKPYPAAEFLRKVTAVLNTPRG